MSRSPIRRGPRAVSRFALLFLAAACSNGDEPDAYGNFEADEVVVAAETGGQLRALDAIEGRTIPAGLVVGYVDTTQLTLERAQLLAQREALATQRVETASQLEALDAQREIAARSWARVQRLIAGGAATVQQRDQAERDDRVLAAQLAAGRAGLQRLDAERNALDARLAGASDRLRRATITNPVSGTVLAMYARAGEIIMPGQSLYRIANLDSLTLRAYVSGGQLSQVRLGGAATVRVDGPDGSLDARPGIVTWIADRAEFTPTPVQTRDERAELVYAVKVRVANPNGTLKIGMPGDVTFARADSGAPTP